jgi:hypothetical protein
MSTLEGTAPSGTVPPGTAPSGTASPEQRRSRNNGWTALFHAMRTQPLVPSPIVTNPLPTSIASDVLLVIQRAHTNGMLTGSGSLTMLTIPDELMESDQIVSCITAYYNQGFQQGVQARLAAVTPHNIPAHPPHTPTPRAPKVANPTPFKGDRAEYGNFVMQLQLVFNADPTRYSNDAQKIVYAASYLEGSAKEWFRPQVDPSTGTIKFDTWTTFINALKVAFDDPDAIATAE